MAKVYRVEVVIYEVDDDDFDSNTTDNDIREELPVAEFGKLKAATELANQIQRTYAQVGQ